MSKFGFVFPGQGSQKIGMLSALVARYPEIKHTFAEASDAISLDLWKIASSGENGLLDQTHITQPVLLTASVAIWRLWLSQGGKLPDLLAGHSLGEYSALVCANVLDFAAAAKTVNSRGKYMQEAVPADAGAMAAILGLDDHKIIELCRGAAQGEVVAAVNFNSTGQTVIAGNKAAVERAMQACKEAGAKRALALNVSVPSHCSLMLPAAEKLGEDLRNLQFREPTIPIVQNVSGRVAKTPEDIRENLLKQLFMPVQWVDSISCMWDFGLGKIIECGPGKVLGGLIKRIEGEIECFSTEDPDSFEQAKAAVSIA
ncbi:MAG: ACP S-malonyltransferase [Gammaproteobacteria bacterium]|nr:ACP S-malonyltransferase [Gammaproteobacteria bacterium]MDP2141154.1 ACP S-malonyltransferase [Gammaproteobacteria bacterium]MDP2349172.1 ACP S-malonyltransferase [Gammaproteobacteria bacterium]